MENIQRSLAPTGVLLLLVPAVESVRLVAKRQPEWLRRCSAAGAPAQPLPESELHEQPESGSGRLGGVFNRAGVATKHFTRDEVVTTVAAARLQLEGLEPVHYEWSTEFSPAPEDLGKPTAVMQQKAAEQMGSPRPFDWLATVTLPGLPNPLAARKAGDKHNGVETLGLDVNKPRRQPRSLPSAAAVPIDRQALCSWKQSKASSQLSHASPPPGITLSEVGTGCIDQLQVLNERCLPMRYPGWFYTDAIDSAKQGICWVARDSEDQLVGAIVGKLEPDRHDPTAAIYIRSLVVDGSYRRQGLGLALLRKVLDAANDSGHIKFSEEKLNRLELHVHVINGAAMKFYARAGFAQVAEVPNYYPPPIEPPNAKLLCLALDR